MCQIVALVRDGLHPSTAPGQMNDMQLAKQNVPGAPRESSESV